MSRTTLIACVAAIVLTSFNSFAITPASQSTKGIGFGVLAEDLTRWHLAAYGAYANRTVKEDKIKEEIRIRRFNTILGYDLTRWLTVYALAGVMDADPKYRGNDQDSTALIGVGAWANLVHSLELSLLSTISYYKLTAGAEITFSDLDDFRWSQADAYLTFEIVNEIENNSNIFPKTVGVFAGPVVSYIISDDYDADSDNVMGLSAGLTMRFSSSTYATISYDMFSDDSIFAGMVGVRF
ncbi:MAG: hypothetical protein GX804_06980 [Lentisphaerae bacterium]|jgi:opacity protein-like surface antigen|nr:hypothetical protein [Lentisphaerota bacterium]